MNSALNGQKQVLGIVLLATLTGFIVLIPQLPHSVEKRVEIPFIVSSEEQKALLFFGFSACSGVCPSTLASLDKTVGTLKPSQRPSVYFIDIDRNSSSEQAVHYATQFNPNFKGIFPSPSLMRQMSNNFGLNITAGLKGITHRGQTYLLEKRGEDWWLVKIYNPDPRALDRIIEELI